ncbi:MAG: DUF2267 domain-containing protein [Chroococcidiopsidaceae cyanobacterium CP_BM_RX_35]|nr:DUF2267 domain-containing protein [Chroococcidiopsidaceae cyanobacterium CP_BM_RX_35]
MVEQAQKQQSFLKKVVERSGLETENQAQRATNVVFRLLRDMMSNQETNRVEEDLRKRASEAEQDAVNLWQDPNVMVAFFSRISPIQKLNISPGTFMLRLKEEGVLPEGVSPELVTQAVFSATKEILSPERSHEVAQALPAEIRQLWEQA